MSWAIVGALPYSVPDTEDASQIAPALVPRNHRGALRLLPQRAVLQAHLARVLRALTASNGP